MGREKIGNSCCAKTKAKAGAKKEDQRKKWEKPVLEDVSGKVMAQPYIRFT